MLLNSSTLIPSPKLIVDHLSKCDSEQAPENICSSTVHDLQPTSTKLVRWTLEEDPFCILLYCSTLWRHDQVLTVFADIMERERRSAPTKMGRKYIDFVKEGLAASGNQTTGVLQDT